MKKIKDMLVNQRGAVVKGPFALVIFIFTLYVLIKSLAVGDMDTAGAAFAAILISVALTYFSNR